MSDTQPALDMLQDWLLTAVTKPECAVASEVGEVVLPSQQQSSAERLAVYQHAYVTRLLDVLRELFPCTRFAIGDELFDQFAAGYLRRYPPHSYALGRLADHWPDFLDETRPTDADWGEFIVELARLEQAIDRIFDGPGPEGLPPFSMPQNASGDLRLALVPGFELHAFQFPVSSYFTAWKAGEHPGWPENREQSVALFRREYIVRRHDLGREQFDLLTAISRGRKLGESLAATTAAEPADVHAWFTRWAAVGFFSAAR